MKKQRNLFPSKKNEFPCSSSRSFYTAIKSTPAPISGLYALPYTYSISEYTKVSIIRAGCSKLLEFEKNIVLVV